MRTLGRCELFNLNMSDAMKQNIDNIARTKLNQNVGDIAPEQIAPELAQLKSKSKNSFFPLLNDALALYEQRGLVRLFNLGVGNGGRASVPIYMPFIKANARNRAKESDLTIPNEAATDKGVIFMNMYRIGGWSADETTYQGLSVNTDLYSVLEGGTIRYKLLNMDKAKSVFNNKVVVENLARIYTNMFAQTIVKCKVPFGNSGTDDFSTDSAYYIIAKFFLKYILEFVSDDLIDSYARLCIKYKSSRYALQSFEESAEIDYTSLSNFLRTFGLAFFQEPIFMMEFNDEWTKSYGECTCLAIEYVPYFLYYLFAASHNALLGGTLRRNKLAATQLNKLGLPKLYAAVITELKN